MKKFLREFKDFAMRGSVIDLAVGVIIGGAFQKIVNSLVKDVISPILGLFAKTNFENWSINAFGVSIRYGAFITEVINFIIMAFVIFVLVKVLNGLAKLRSDTSVEEKEPTTKKCPYCMTEIDIKATRCPHCTSIIEDDNKDDKNNEDNKNNKDADNASSSDAITDDKK